MKLGKTYRECQAARIFDLKTQNSCFSLTKNLLEDKGFLPRSPKGEHSNLLALEYFFRELSSVPEVPYSGEDHSDFVFVGGLDHFWIALGTSGLYDCLHPGFSRRIHPISHGKEGV